MRWWPLAAAAVLLAVVVDVVTAGPLVRLDVAVQAYAPLQRWPALEDAAWVMDDMGLRGLTVPLLVVVALLLRWRTGDWRPLLVVVVSELALNLVVGSTKLATGRGFPRDGDPALGQDGIIFPSGHAANTALCAALLVHFAGRWRGRRLRRRTQVAAVAGPTATMAAISLYLGTHWVTDLVVGALVGLLLARAALRWQEQIARVARRLTGWRLDAPGVRARTAPPARPAPAPR
ncbi:Membrane-associated phospholipid phosphatase [Quadrisphaera sp. DSM 44207]|nr:Membrane-associated phospholipid phosphatase [Quadrisphaera sp. DSM 44207]